MGSRTVVTTDAETVFRGQVSSLADLKAGMLAGAVTKEATGGALLAKIVRAGDPIGVHFGEITSVNAAGGTFTLKTQRTAQELSVSVDENTRFRSREAEISGLDELKSGMFALVVGKSPAGEQNKLEAVLVAASEKSDLPEADLIVGGRIVALERGAFTIESREGEEYVFQTSKETRIRSREIRSVAGLKLGMLVLVGAKDLGSGKYQAQVVLVVPQPRR